MNQYNVATSAIVSRAQMILENKIETGRNSARHLFEYAHTQTPEDAIVRTGAINFAPTESGIEIVYGNVSRGIHRNALTQIAGKASVPSAYLAELASGKKEWQRELAATVLNEHFHKGDMGERHLLRSTNNEVRGFLSDRYRRLDSRPLLEAFAESCQQVGAVPIDGHVTDTRLALKAVLPMVFEPAKNEAICFGVEWGNSDYGAARHSLRAFILRLWCLNGATMEDALAQVHLGARLGDNIEFSQKTYELDTATSVSALRDMVQGLLGTKQVNSMVEMISRADEHKIDWRAAKNSISKKLLKAELKAVEEAYKSDDVVNLPAGESVWRVSNAISWIAGRTEDQDRKLELQRLAGEVINGKRDGAVAEAA